MTDDDLDAELRSALRPLEPPPGFSERVMARVAPVQMRPVRAHWRVPVGLAATVLLGLGIYIGVQHEQRQQLAGLEARRQVIEALRLTDQKLAIVSETVRDEAGI
jgi:hypothetical protein